MLLKIDVNGGEKYLDDIVDIVLTHDDSRLVLDFSDSKNVHSKVGRGKPKDMMEWAKDELSSWGDAVIDKRGYVPMPQFKGSNKQEYRRHKILDTVYICPEFLRKEFGNRACFNKCT